MFGTIIAERKNLTPDENRRYHGYYCGLCGRLGAHFGSAGSETLTYDMTFLALLLSSLYQLEEITSSRRCAARPIRPRTHIHTPATDYAAGMNLVLAYYQRLDDWQDDKSRRALRKSRRILPFLPDVEKAYPRQCAAIDSCLRQLGRMEKDNELNPDLPANCFGGMMGEIFVWREDRHASDLRKMGAALGRFIYLLDAANDLRSDIKNERYNPLVAQADTDFITILTLMMAECVGAFDALPIKRDRRILQNILFSGVWQGYGRKPERTKTHDG